MRAERPGLPWPDATVPSAMPGLTAEFGMGSGDPRLHGSARKGRSRMLAAPLRLHARGPQHARACRNGETDRWLCSIEELGLLVTLASGARTPCSYVLSTRCSAWALTRKGTDLGGGFPLRCFQRLSVPDVARRPCRWSTTAPPEVRPPRSSRTRGSSPQSPCARGG